MFAVSVVCCQMDVLPWYVRNAGLHRDLKMEMVTAEIRRCARKHEERLLHHDNVKAIQLLDTVSYNAGLREQPYLSWYHDQKKLQT